MSKAEMVYREIRFIIEEDLTLVYVLIEAKGDCPIGVQGWHHKVFSSKIDVVTILSLMIEDSPVLWPLDSPEK